MTAGRGRESKKISRSRKRNLKDVGHKDKVIPIVVGALGTIPLRLKENLRTIGVDTSIELKRIHLLLFKIPQYAQKLKLV